MNKSDTISELTKALVQVQANIEGAKTDAVNPFFKMKYASLASVWGACRKLLTDNGLAVVQTCSVDDRSDLIIDTTLLHTTGEWIGGQMRITPSKNDPQGLGSAMSYGRRYCLAAIIGIYQEDDDAEKAVERPATVTRLEPKKQAKPMTVAEASKVLAKLEADNPSTWGHILVAERLMDKYGAKGDCTLELLNSLSVEALKEVSVIIAGKK